MVIGSVRHDQRWSQETGRENREADEAQVLRERRPGQEVQEWRSTPQRSLASPGTDVIFLLLSILTRGHFFHRFSVESGRNGGGERKTSM